MSAKIFKLDRWDLVKSDLRNLKCWKSLQDDVFYTLKIAHGKVTDNYSNIFSSPLGYFITEKKIDTKRILFYKLRVKITSPMVPSANGGRLVYAVLVENDRIIYLPILIFRAADEGKTCCFNGKYFSLTLSGFKSIIEEKLAFLSFS